MVYMGAPSYGQDRRRSDGMTVNRVELAIMATVLTVGIIIILSFLLAGT
jgi:hypothetical protein